MNTKKTIIKRIKKLANVILNLVKTKNKKSFSYLINHITDTYEKAGLISIDEKNMFRNMVNFGDRKIATIMIPRSDIIAINEDANLQQIKKIITDEQHSRIPLYRDNIDHIVGFVHSKDLMKFLYSKPEEFNLQNIARKILFVPCSAKLIDTLLKMRSARVHIAIVLDEFGAVDGLVTIENIIEQIVGSIDDEHDIPLESSFFQIKKIDDKTYQFGGRVTIEKAQEILKIKFEENQAETIGGLVISTFNNIPKIGDKIDTDFLSIKVLDVDKRIVKAVEITSKSKSSSSL